MSLTLKPSPLELFFQIAQGHSQSGWPAVGAVAAAVDEMAAGQQGIDLGGGEGVAGFDGGFAGHHVEDFVQEFFLVQIEGFLLAAFQ